MIITLYKVMDGQELKAVGHFTEEEAHALLAEGFSKRSRQQVNKHGIPIV
ncbi:hypothetical protein NSQ62_14500 [Solibacillus sp. FSL H8-0523]